MFTHSVVVPNESVTAGTSPSYDLPVSPLSHCLVTVKFAQNVANTQLAFANIAAMISKMEVLYKGAGVFSMNALDAIACGLMICNFESWGINAVGEDNELRSFTFLVPFGRQLYSPVECYPPTSRGELVLQITWAASFTDIDGVSLQVESIELPDSHPERFLKMTTASATPTSTQEFDVDLPIGNQISDIILWGATIPAIDVATTTIEEIEVRKNNSEYMYSKSFFETLHNMSGRLRAAPGYWAAHVHQLDDAAYAQYMDTGTVKPSNHILSNHLLIPFDVRRDGVHILRTDDAKDLCVRIKPGDTGAIRIIPAEVVAIGAR
ncbi:MAG: hypothetical protein HWN68_14995 [Desulfobacterales bacterium]|nr:hypothetical protein [Desulfobacterales bacterium]